MKKSKLSILSPLNAVTFVTHKGIEKIQADSLIPDIIGLKALGLACLPKAWTLPFIVISKELLEEYSAAKANKGTSAKIAISNFFISVKSSLELAYIFHS